MRRAGVIVAATLVVACGAFGTSGEGVDPTPQSGGDGGAVGETGAPTADSGEPGQPNEAGAHDALPGCSDFAFGNDGWTTTGEVQQNAMGYRILLSGSAAHITKSFTHTAPINSSHVTLSWDVSGGVFMTEPTVFVLSQFYGSSTANAPQTNLVTTHTSLRTRYADGTSGVGVFQTNEFFAGSEGAPFTLLNGVGTQIDTIWGSPGKVTVTSGGGAESHGTEVQNLSSSLVRSSTFYLQLGGRTTDVSGIAVTIRGVCVSFD